MRRAAAAAIVATGLALLASGCGVQPTGVNVAQTEPFNIPGSSSSQTVSPSRLNYEVDLFLYPTTNGLAKPVVRRVGSPAESISSLLEQLKTVTEDEAANGLVTYVPQDLQLMPTSNAHQYQVVTARKINTFAQQQLACTFSWYWRQHPDGQLPSSQFIFPNGTHTDWSDCAYQFDTLLATPKFPAKGSAPGPITVQPTGN
jgi:hypothetical protein